MEDNRTHCETFQTDGDKRITVEKKKYDTLESASYEAKKLNARPTQKMMLVPYQCTVCTKFHLGRNGKPIMLMYRQRLIKELKIEEWHKKNVMPKFKIIGKIDLDNIKLTPKEARRFAKVKLKTQNES